MKSIYHGVHGDTAKNYLTVDSRRVALLAVVKYF